MRNNESPRFFFSNEIVVVCAFTTKHCADIYPKRNTYAWETTTLPVAFHQRLFADTSISNLDVRRFACESARITRDTGPDGMRWKDALLTMAFVVDLLGFS